MAQPKNEWTADDPFAVLSVPKERLATQRYTFSTPNGIGLHGTCADFEIQPAAVRLKDVLIDTSERYQGTVLKKRVTHREWLLLTQIAVVIFPTSSIELENDAPARVET
jgi:hypothetical protein